MNYTTAIFLISDEVKMHAVVFFPEKEGNILVADTPKRYSYKTFDKDLKVGDYVVVPSSVEKNSHGMSIAQIVELDVEVDFESTHKYKWLVGSISLDNFKEIEEKEAQALAAIKSAEKTRKRKELKADLMADAGSELKKLGYDTKDPDNATDLDDEIANHIDDSEEPE